VRRRIAFGHHEWGEKRGEDRELARLTLRGVWQRAEVIECATEQAHSLDVCVNLLRHLGGAVEPRRCLIDDAGPLVMCSDLSGYRASVRCVKLLEGPRDAKVMAPPARGAQRYVGHLADPVVREIVCVGTVLANDAPLPDLVQCAHQCFVGRAARMRENLGRELATDRRCHTHQITSGIGKLPQAGFDHRLHLWTQLPASAPCSCPFGTQRLHDE
jgi:hypothetical protein